MLRILCVLFFVGHGLAGYIVDKAVAKIEGDATGIITLTQEGPKKEVKIVGEIQNLKAGKHGFHVHVFGDLSNGCASAAAHFNPYNKTHGDITSKERHVGDLGNIEASNSGVAVVRITDSMISLNGENSIIGRAIVVHADEDDLGLGGQPDSKTTGHAGARAGCGVIGIASMIESAAISTISINGLFGVGTAFLTLMVYRT